MPTEPATATSTPKLFQIQGTARLNGRPTGSATVRLLGGADTVGTLPGAALDTTAHLAWTRRLTDFEGSLWLCWNKHVANRVAGLNWPAFQAQVRTHNPGLAADGDRFHAAKRYLLPANPMPAPEIVWDREITGFTGHLWHCWQRYVAHRVVGLSYDPFKTKMAAHNPNLDAALRRGDPIRLPRNTGERRYYLETATGERGRFRFELVPPGAYTLRVDAPGAQRFEADLVCAEDMTLHIPLARFADAPPQAASRGASRSAQPSHPWVGVHHNELVAGVFDDLH